MIHRLPSPNSAPPARPTPWSGFLRWIRSGLLAWLTLPLLTPGTAAPAYLPPEVQRVEPADGTVNLLPDPTLRINLRNRDSRVATNTIRLLFAGRDVTDRLRFLADPGGWTVTFQPDLLSGNTTYSASLVFADNRTPAFLQTNRWSFTTANLAVISGQRRVSPTNGALPGFRVRSIQTSPNAKLADSAEAAEKLLSFNPFPIPANQAYATVPLLNFARAGFQTSGEFDSSNGRTDAYWSDYALDTNGAPFAVEIRGFIDLPQGRNRLGFIADDGYQLILLGNEFDPGDLNLGSSLGGDDGERQFDYFTQYEGLYPFRLVYWDVGGPSFFEFFSVDPATGQRTLVNDRAAPGALKVWVAPPEKIPPAIISQPADRTNEIGRNITLQVIAEPDLPTNYEWRKGDLRLDANAHFSGATNATLTLRNAQFLDAGEYSVRVGNAHGIVTSRVASVTVTRRTTPDCEDIFKARIPADLVSWWTGDEPLPSTVGFDSVTERIGRMVGTVTNAPGLVGKAMKFNRTGGIVFENSDPFNFPTNGAFTLGAWVKADVASALGAIMVKRSNSALDRRDFGLYQNGSNFEIRPGVGLGARSVTAIRAGTWYFVAASYTNQLWSIYINGVRENQAFSSAILPTNGKLAIGQDGEVADAAFRFSGLVDEAFFFRRALDASEVKFLYDRVNAVTSPQPLLCRPPNNLPIVELISPKPGASAVGPASFSLEASARDLDGDVTLERVEFFDADRLIGTSTQLPYKFLWTDVPPGTHTISAVATDNRGGAGRSGSAEINVVRPPVLILHDASVREGESGQTNLVFVLELDAPAEFPALVEVVTRDGTALSTSDYVPLTLTEVAFAPGETRHTVEVTVLGDKFPEKNEFLFLDVFHSTGVVVDAARRSATGTIISDDRPNSPPNVILRTPVFDQPFNSPGDITAKLEISDAEADPVVVEVFGDGAPLATLTQPPWEVRWTGLSLGYHTLLVRAHDDHGGTTELAPVRVNVVTPPDLTIADESILEGSEGTNILKFVVRLSKLGVSPVTLDYATRPDSATEDVDFRRAAGRLTVPVSLDFAVVEVPILGDKITERDESFFLDLTGIVGAYPIRSTAIGTIRNDDKPNQPPSVSLTSPTNAFRVMQGNPVLLRAEASDPDGTVARVSFLADGTEIARTNAAPFAATWLPPRTGIFSLLAMATDDFGDSVSSTNVTRIEVLPRPDLGLEGLSKAEGRSGITQIQLPIRLSRPSLDPVSFVVTSLDDTAEAGSDYRAFTNTISYLPGEIEKTITLEIFGDAVPEADESFVLEFSRETGVLIPVHRLSITIRNDDLANVPPTVALVAPTNRFRATVPTSIEFVANALDPDGAVTRVEFLRNETVLGASTGPAPYRFKWDAPAPGTYVLSARAIDDAGAITSSPAVTVTLLAPPVLTVADEIAVEGSSGTNRITFKARLSPAPELPASVRYATVAGTATAPDDFQAVAGTLVFAPGETEKIIAVELVADRMLETDETFKLAFSEPVGLNLERPAATGTILDDDVGNRPPVVVLVSPSDGTRVPGPARIQLLAVATDPDGAVARVEFFDGPTRLGESLAPPFAFLWPDAPVGTHVLTARAIDPDGAAATSLPITVTVTGNPTLTVADASAPEGTLANGHLVFVARLSAVSAEAVSVQFATRPGTARGGIDYFPLADTLTFAPGETEKRIDVTLVADSIKEPEETFRLEWSDPRGLVLARTSVTGTILDDDLDDGVALVSLIQPTNGFRANVPAAIDLVAQVNAAAGTSRRVEFFRNGSLLGETTGPSPLHFLWDEANPGTFALTARITDDTGRSIESAPVIVTLLPLPALSVGDEFLVEGNTGTNLLVFHVRLSAPALAPVTVGYATVPGTAEAGVDYHPTGGTLSFAAGELEKTISIQVLADRVAETDETFQLALSDPTGARLDRATATATLLDDDAGNQPPAIVLVSPTAGSRFSAPARLELVAIATDPEGALARVEFFDGATSLGTVTNAPFILVWPEAPIGTHVLAARAFDAEGASTASAPVTVVVAAVDLPVLSIADASANEGSLNPGRLTFVARLSAVALVPVSVRFATLSGTAQGGVDFVPRAELFEFAPGETEKRIEIALIADTETEPNETLRLELSDPRGLTLARSSITGTIVDDDVAGSPPLVSLDSPTNGFRASVPATVPLVARLGVPAGTLTRVEFLRNDLKLGEATGPSPVTFNWNETVPGTYVLAARVTDDSGRAFVSAPVVVTLLPIPVLTFADESLVEGHTGTNLFHFRVRLSAPPLGPVSVRYATTAGTATAGTDFLPVSGILRFATGETEKTIDVPILGDRAAEPDESLRLLFSEATGATLERAAASLTILDDDAGNLPPAVTLVSPADGTRATAPARLELVAVASDPEGNLARVEFFDGATSLGSVTNAPFLLVWTNAPAGNHVLTARAFDNEGTSTPSVPVTVVVTAAADVPVMSIADASATEGTLAPGRLTFIARLSAAASGTVSVRFATLSGTAKGGVDFVPRAELLEFAPGETEKRIEIALIADTDTEPDESLRLELSDPRGLTLARPSITGTIVDDDVAGSPPLVSLDSPTNGFRASVPATIPLTARIGVPAGAVTRVEFLRNDLKLGEATGASPVTFNWNETVPGTYVLAARVTDDSGRAFVSAPVVVTLLPLPVLSFADASVVEGNTGTNRLNFRARLSAPALGPVSLRYATAAVSATEDADFVAVSGTLVFAAGEFEKSISLPIIADRRAEADETFRLVLTEATGATLQRATATITILDDDAENRPPAIALVAPLDGLRRPAPARIDLVADASDPDGNLARVDFLDGSTLLASSVTPPHTFAWTNAAAGPHVLTARATDLAGVATTSAPVRITITTPPTLRIDDVSGLEGTSTQGRLVFVARLSASATDPASVNYATVNGTARAGLDFLPIAGTLSFAVGETEQRLEITLPADAEVEPDKSFRLELTNARNLIPERTSILGTILNDDSANRPPTITLTSPATGLRTNAPVVLRLAAEASDSDGTIRRVEFFLDAVGIGESTTAPFRLDREFTTPGTYTLAARATDDRGETATSAPVTVTLLDPAPVLIAPGDVAIDEGVPWEFALRLQTPAPAADRLAFSLLASPPGMTVSPEGILRWTPRESDGPGVFAVTARVAAGSASDQRSFKVTVREINAAPLLAAVADVSLGATESLALDLSATDADLPAQTLAFRLLQAPPGMTVSATGAVRWTPGPAAPGSTNPVIVQVSDGSLAAQQAFRVVVRAPLDQRPTVALTQPLPFTVVRPDATVALRAEASGGGGLVVRVDFYADDQWIGTDTTPPFTGTFVSPPAGFHQLSARVTDDRGLTAVSELVRLEVTPFTPNVLIVGFPEEPEVQREQEYLFATDRSARIVRPENFATASLDNIQLVLWCGAGRSGVTPAEIAVLGRLRDQAMPLYFIGERLASMAAGRSTADLAAWRSLVHLEPRTGLLGATSIAFTQAGLEYLGALGSVLDHAPSDGGYESALATDGAVLGRSGQRDALIAWPVRSATEPARGHRVIVQNLLVSTPGTPAANAARAVLFQSAVCWLTRCQRCAPFNLILEDQVRTVTAPIEEIIDIPIALLQRNECVSTGVRLEATLPPEVEFVGGRASIGQGFEHDGEFTFVIGEFAAGDRLEVILQLRAKVPGRYEFPLRARANESLGDNFDSQMSVVIDATAATARPSVEIRFLESSGNLVVSWPSWGTDWNLESAAAPLPTATWAPIPTPPVVAGNRLETTIPKPSRATFFRLRR